MGKTKVGGSQLDSSQKEDLQMFSSNGNGESVEGPAAKKRKIESKHKNGAGNLSANGEESQMSAQSSSSSTQSKQESLNPKPGSSFGFSLECSDGNAAERIKTASLCRQRKQVERFMVTSQVSSRDKSITIPEGNGSKLQNIQYIAQQINNARTSDLLKIHKFIFGRVGIHAEVKPHLKSFSGFSFTSDSAEYDKKKRALIKLEKPERDYLCEFFGLNKSGTKESVVESILEFLLSPSADLLKAKPKGKESSKSPSPKKEAKAKSPKKLTIALGSVGSPAKKGSPVKAKAETKKKTTTAAPKPTKGRKPAKQGSKKSAVSPKAKASPKNKKKAAVKPVFNVKTTKKGPKKATSLNQDEEMEESPIDEAEIEKKDEVLELEVANLGSKTKRKSPVKPSFNKKGKAKKIAPKNIPVEEEEEVEDEEEEDQEADDVASNSSSEQ